MLEECFKIEELEPKTPLEITGADYSEVICAERPNSGHIEVFVEGGVPDPSVNNPLWAYDFQWSTGDNPITNKLDNLVPGTYCVTVTDYCDETVSACYTFVANPELVLDGTIVNSCGNQSTGSVTVNPSGGTPPYNYSWGSNSRNNLAAGVYCIYVTDAVGCQINKCFRVDEFPAIEGEIVVTNDCQGFGAGAIEITINNGDGPFLFNWSNGASTQNLESIGTGTYSVTITDIHDCETYATMSVVNGLFTTNSSTPCGVSTICNGEEVKFDEFPLNCSYDEPNNCTVEICDCSLTGQTVSVTDHGFNNVRLNSSCSLLGDCPGSGVTQTLATGNTGTRPTVLQVPCPSGSDDKCYGCATLEVCVINGVAYHDPQIHAPPILSGSQLTLSTPVQSPQCPGECLSQAFCDNRFVGPICVPCNNFNDDDYNNLLEVTLDNIRYASTRKDLIYVYSEDQDKTTTYLKGTTGDQESFLNMMVIGESIGMFSDISKIYVPVTSSITASNQLSVFPNPLNSDILNLDISVTDGLKVISMYAINSMGKRINDAKSFNHNEGIFHQINFRGSNLVNGVIYIKVILSNGETLSTKVVVQR